MNDTVSIACKLPHGLLLQLQRPITVAEPTPTAPDRKVQRWEKHGQVFAIKGFAQPMDRPSEIAIVGGFALTHGIPADFAEKWFAQNADHPAVTGGFIYVSKRPTAAEGYAREHAKLKSGFEAADPNDLPDEFKGDIETAKVEA